MYYRVHWPDCPPFAPENATSAPWGADTEPCPRCQGAGEVAEREHGDWGRQTGSMIECPECGGAGEVPVARLPGYSCCESAESLLEYFAARGGVDGETPVAIFRGKSVGTGPDGEPLVIPVGRTRWTTYAKLRAHVTRNRIAGVHGG